MVTPFAMIHQHSHELDHFQDRFQQGNLNHNLTSAPSTTNALISSIVSDQVIVRFKDYVCFFFFFTSFVLLDDETKKDNTVLTFSACLNDQVQQVIHRFCRAVTATHDSDFRVFAYGGKPLMNFNDTLRSIGMDHTCFVYAFNDPDPNIESTSKLCVVVQSHVSF